MALAALTGQNPSHSVGRQLRIAFLLIAAMSLMASAVAFFSFNAIEKAQDEIVDKALPTIVAAQKASGDARLLVTLIEELVTSDNLPLLDLRIENIQLNDASLNDLISLLELDIEDAENSTRISNLLTDIRQSAQTTDTLIRDRFAQERARDDILRLGIATASSLTDRLQVALVQVSSTLAQQTEMLATRNENLLAEPDQDGAQTDAQIAELLDLLQNEPAIIERLIETRFRAERLTEILNLIPTTVDPQEIDRFEASFKLNLRSVVRLVSTMPDQELRRAVAADLGIMRDMTVDGQNIFNRTKLLTETDGEIDALREQNLFLSAAVDVAAQTAVSASNENAIAVTKSAESVIHSSRIFLVLIVLAAFAVSAFVILQFISKNIIRRLNYLTERTLTLAAGNTDIIIEKQGDDELSQMAKALEIFKENARDLQHQTQELQTRTKALEQSNTDLREAEQRFVLAAQGSSVGIWDWPNLDEDKEIWSDRFYELLGYTPGEIPASLENFMAMLHPDDHEVTFAASTAHVEHQKPFNVEYRLRHKNGDYRWFLGTGQAAKNEDEQSTRMVGTIMDIDDRKRSDEEIRRFAADLERSNAELEQFAYIASHDLQEPLRMVSSYCDLIDRRYADKLDDDGREFLAYAVDGASRMKLLLNDLLQYSRIGRSKIDLRPVDLNETTSQVLVDLKTLIEEQEGVVEVADLPVVLGDQGLLHRVLLNLIQNGLKFVKDEPPRVEISATVDDDWVTVSVLDRGVGIDPKFSERIFEVFQRLQSRRDFAGNGVGLSVAQKIIENHDGHIWLEPTDGGPTIFKFTLKLAQESDLA